MPTKTVTIYLNNGDIGYSDERIKVDQDDEVEWGCDNPEHHFSVHFGYNSPLPKGRYRTRPKGRTGGKVVGKPGIYKYFVAVFDGENIWTDDPDLIVRRGG